MKKNSLIILPGINPVKRLYAPLIKSLSYSYNVYYFKWGKNKSLSEIVEDLRLFIKRSRIRKADFLTHSFGSVIFRMFYQKKNCSIRKVVLLAPLNKGSKVLKYCHSHFPLAGWILGRASREFLQNKRIRFLPLPKKIFVVAGTRDFSWRRIESYFLPLFFNLNGSDGQVFLEETTLPKIKPFQVNEYHSFLMSRKEVIKKVKDFLSTTS